jgi:hypothetical protein
MGMIHPIFCLGMPNTVRFSVVLQASGEPEVYLPLTNPRNDRQFMQAVREHRVLSLKQEPAGSKKDFATVGFVEEKFVSYLVFPKSLEAFEDKRVIGIKYDRLQTAEVTTPRGGSEKRPPKPRATSTGKQPGPTPPESKPKPSPPPPPPQFTATVRCTATEDVTVTVEARNPKEARSKAEESARSKGDWSAAKVETKVVRLRREAGTRP